MGEQEEEESKRVRKLIYRNNRQKLSKSGKGNGLLNSKSMCRKLIFLNLQYSLVNPTKHSKNYSKSSQTVPKIEEQRTLIL